jgi:hypothetical protein
MYFRTYVNVDIDLNNCSYLHMRNPFLKFCPVAEAEIILRPPVNRPAYLGIVHPPGAHDQILITIGQLRFSSCGTPLSDERTGL